MAQIPQDNAALASRGDGAAPPAPSPTPTPSNTTTAKAGRAVREIVETLLLAALIFFAVRLVVLNFKVDGASMTPNLHNEEMLLVNRNAYASVDLDGLRSVLPGEDDPNDAGFYPFSPPERGDIVVFDPPTRSGKPADKPYIKRIIGLPGEQVRIDDADGVYINGVLLDEPYIDQETVCDGRRANCDLVVPAGNVYVLGDNRTNSSDSRVFGPVPVENVIGKAWFAYWPPSDIGLVPHHDYPGIPDSPVASAMPAATPVADQERRRDRDERRRERLGEPAATPAP